jgi:small-conductance mechanosensitive channel
VRAAFRRSAADLPERNVRLVLGRLAQGGLNLLGLLVAVTIMFPSVRPVDLLSLLGISGVAIGFAFKDVLQNFLAGILILLRQPFRRGDQIRFKDFEGTVEGIETRTTVIKTYDGRRVFIPNGEVFTNAVTVNTAYESRRSEHDVGIGYGDDPERAATLMTEAMRGVEGVRAEPPPEALVMELAESSVNVRARWWTGPRQHEVLKVRSKVLTAIRQRLTQEGIDLPFPTSLVLFHDQTEESDGDRTRQREGWPAGRNPPKPRTVAGALERRGTGGEERPVHGDGRAEAPGMPPGNAD